MTEIVEGAKEALAIARGEIPAARIHHRGHAYVPEAKCDEAADEIARLKEEVARKDRMLVIAGRVISGKITLAEADAEARAALTSQEPKDDQ